ncbi:MAG: hypothetical protein JWM10_4833 [Myxococcaceae bacterium]|nr:hypothetical protein [Myxococcaceae bacterium]
MTDKKWKPRLQSSSLPLEFEIAKTLVESRFSVTSDYTYGRGDDGSRKEYSVDVHARGGVPYDNENQIRADVDLLIECKHRKPGIKWLFLPDPNRPDYSPITLGCTLRALDEFSPRVLPANATISFDETAVFCYKATEIDEGDGNVDDRELRHGLVQLQYALPSLIKSNIQFNVPGGIYDTPPLFFCPILVTNAELIIANTSLTMSEVDTADKVGDLGQSVSSLVYYLDYGPDFERHCRSECVELMDVAENSREYLSSLHAKRKRAGAINERSGVEICRAYATAERFQSHGSFCQFVVCTKEGFKDVLAQIKKVTAAAVRSGRTRAKRQAATKPSAKKARVRA